MLPLRTATVLLCLILTCAGTTVTAAESPEDSGVQAGFSKVEAAARKAGAAGTRAEKWAREREALLNEARQLLFDTEATHFAATRQEAYIAREEADIRELSDRLTEALATRSGLESVMEALYADLARAVETGLPFAMDERQTRLALVRRTLDDPDIAPGDKLGSLLEALRIEAGYGLSIEAEDAIMSVNDTPTALTLLRVGGLALLRLPASGVWVERYNPATHHWDRLDDPGSRELIKTVQITRKRRIAELVTLPVGSLKQLKSATPASSEAQ
ncbi:DUF3450 family protein [Pseudodesulfovibrio sediminis]|uniref:DUF3450 domain-containing protein n=1 Tax=Pseudodesulfovibrio sediminis TaxID=2810563 RepID=A0ABM7P335_9BACT|nr:DUF3450 family protein [Pseudodesulfovibrio sediminis]BCS88077.1 hypothetical protein PSDVSF_13190 [Pseudodesulfovibrio sediminis]